MNFLFLYAEWKQTSLPVRSGGDFALSDGHPESRVIGKGWIFGKRID